MKKFYITTIIALLYIPIITIGSELSAPLKNLLKGTFWHHWLGKSIVLILMYALIYGLLSFKKWPDDEKKDGAYLTAIMLVTFVGTFSVFGFFVYEYLKHI
ncbi:hypothetical protein KBD59_04615 [Candidatus Gracilibacteria bacterium]|nr:hypothetical protein [Candidatus Gracilibacteria bacterium]